MRFAWVGTCLGLLCAATASAAEKVDWRQVLEPAPKVQLPAPLEAGRWRGDLGNAFEQARGGGRAGVLTSRVLSWKACAALGKGGVEGGPGPAPPLKQLAT